MVVHPHVTIGIRGLPPGVMVVVVVVVVVVGVVVK